MGKGVLKICMLNYYVLQHVTLGKNKRYLHLLKKNIYYAIVENKLITKQKL